MAAARLSFTRRTTAWMEMVEMDLVVDKTYFELHAGRCLFSCMRICMYDWLLGSERSRTTTWLQEYLSSMHSDDRGSEEVERGVNDVLDELHKVKWNKLLSNQQDS
eukprot:TRINITY_DN12415_c4_g1_i2.p2 TRINITY_DN12415_c4_g1~~TRINITY_DN12415_c4_g1_i2.p2  ORF type:complete len:106 (+),score=20.94 TRINITY_DN12415_c4_g1_i2:753-1070(+)